MSVLHLPQPKRYPGVSYAVGREKIREYAYAVGESAQLTLDLMAARSAGFADLVAPPMFVVVYSSPAIGPAILDPEIGMNIMAMVHGGQEFHWHEPVIAGDEITTTVTFEELSVKGGKGFYQYRSYSENQIGKLVCEGIWTFIVRGFEQKENVE